MDCSLEIRSFLANVESLPPHLLRLIQSGTNQQFLDTLSKIALKEQYTDAVLVHFEPILPELCARWAASHDLVETVSALGRVLCFAPHLSQLAYDALLSQCPGQDLLGHFLALDAASRPSNHCHAQQIRSLLLGIFRLLVFDNGKFADFVRPLRFLSLIQLQDQCNRYLAIRIICLFLHASDSIYESMIERYLGSDSVEAELDGKLIDFLFLSLWEERRTEKLAEQLQAARAARQSRKPDELSVRRLDEDDFSGSVVNFHQILLARSDTSEDVGTINGTIVATSTTAANVQSLAKALLYQDPVLVTGPPGSGKSLVVNHVARKLKKSSSMITLHLNEQSDAKLLVGIYTMGAEPGSFQWRPGVLATAVMEGRWVFIEDLNRAPGEIMSVLLPLIERGELSVPGHDSVIQAANGFRLLATMQADDPTNLVDLGSNSRMLGYRWWRQIHFSMLSVSELRRILVVRYPRLENFADYILAVFQSLHRICTRSTFPLRTHHTNGRMVGIRSLLRWSTRINTHLQPGEAQGRTGTISDTLLDNIFLDAVDCFAGRMKGGDMRDLLISSIAEELQIHPQRIRYLLDSRVPTINRQMINKGDLSAIGRARLMSVPPTARKRASSSSPLFALNNHSLHLMERIAMSVQHKEPLLLVGETGIGKTAAIQNLSCRLGQPLLVINLSQQSESGDLLGGYKPTNPRSIIMPLKDEFDLLFEETFSGKRNQRFKHLLAKSLAKGHWKRVVNLWKEALKMIDSETRPPAPEDLPANEQEDARRHKRRKIDNMSHASRRSKWKSFSIKVETLEQRLAVTSDSFAFQFEEGKLIHAVRDGGWVLLDEINLATTDTLECLLDLLDSGSDVRPSILLTESGAPTRVQADPKFRIFASMNPATDVGKRELPPGIQSRFTEIHVESPDADVQSLTAIVEVYMRRTPQGLSDQILTASVTELYLEIQRLAHDGTIQDGTGHRPHYSLRTLSRSLDHAVVIAPRCSIRKALHEGFAMCFFTCLNAKSEDLLHQKVVSTLFASSRDTGIELKKPLRSPQDGMSYVKIPLKTILVDGSRELKEESHWLPKGPREVQVSGDYIVTPYIRRNLGNLIRAVSTRKHPVLIQGPTSSGKTSMIEYLAKRSGNKFVRINNHDHTDLSEYMGNYVSDADGSLFFQDGVLVQAVRNGYWVVLDELNLAPTEVLEALNRLLDDNRELFIPETQEVIRPHHDFMLFATQNPVGAYGGRKTLSRAFRNRFLEMHFDDIPVAELNVILAKRSKLPESWCGLIVDVYKRLSEMRQESRIFEQHSFATLRDLFRWAFRGADNIETLAKNGYMLLVEKIRISDEREFVKRCIEQILSRRGAKLSIDETFLYAPNLFPEMSTYDSLEAHDIVWTSSMRRLYGLVSCAIRNNEPVLLVGETGCGKTAVCQMLAQTMRKKLHTVNAHQNLEAGDLVGSQRPNRDKGKLEIDLIKNLRALLSQHDPAAVATSNLADLLNRYDKLPDHVTAGIPVGTRKTIDDNRHRMKTLFMWKDGPLIQAMRSGTHFLLDEISLAEDSVLERMNSVLDPQRSILLAEKGTSDSEVFATEGFQLFGTMNPGGDFGKKELSPALRNRFTEIWVPPLSNVDDALEIVKAKIMPAAFPFAQTIVDFAKWFGETYRASKESSISIRDILSWVQFVNSTKCDAMTAVVEGAMTVFIDSIGANPSGLVSTSGIDVNKERRKCLAKLGHLTGNPAVDHYKETQKLSISDQRLRMGVFSIAVEGSPRLEGRFRLEAPTTRSNAFRIIRALQSPRPLLVEGDPGVGKTSLVTAIASCSGRPLVRINLSEQTDIMDLFGSDVPVEDAEAGAFRWRDAPFLTAMKKGDWILLDEMNLASQSVLEGLNACIDHRGEAYVPELDRTFPKHDNFRLFAAQNPHHQGGGRKGLPASFVNRFTVVFMNSFQKHDLHLICAGAFPQVTEGIITKVVDFVDKADSSVNGKRLFAASGSPWEFNLRDAFRCLDLITSSQGFVPAGSVHDILDIVFNQRLRKHSDVIAMDGIVRSCFGKSERPRSLFTNLTPQTLQVGLGLLPRNDRGGCGSLDRCLDREPCLPLMQSLMICIQQRWPVILAGPSGAGKSLTLSSLASLVGADLEVLSMSPGFDAGDLIGVYDQVDPIRQSQSVLRKINDQLRFLLLELLSAKSAGLSGRLYSNLANLVEEIKKHSPYPALVTHVMQALSHVKEDITANECDFSKYGSNLELLLAQLAAVCAQMQSLSVGRFYWVDGPLIKALEAGRWLVLDNVNYCPSSVLDRLNSLLEPNGTLIVNEHCSEDGAARIVRPHPKFRIFLTMDPKHGEVSRAMRNRAVELFVHPRNESINLPTNHVYRHIFRGESRVSRLREVIELTKSVANTDEAELSVQMFRLSVDRLGRADLAVVDKFLCQAQSGLLSSDWLRELSHMLYQRRTFFKNETALSLATQDHYAHLQQRLDAPSCWAGLQVSQNISFLLSRAPY